MASMTPRRVETGTLVVRGGRRACATGANQGNLKEKSVVAAILPSRMEVSYCTFGFH